MTLPSSPPSPRAPTSVDPDEVAFYERLAARWWDPAGPFWPLHRLNSVRVPYLCNALARHFGLPDGSSAPLSGLKILDIGCGGGILSESLARLGAEVHGVDVVEKNIRIATLHASEQGLHIRYETRTAERLAADNARYDAVMNLEVVEHVADLESFLSACCTLVRPGGMMAIASLNRTWLAYLAAIVMGEYVLRWLPRGTHRWSKFPRPAELQRSLQRKGMHVVDRIGVRINPLTRTFALSRLQAINFMLTATKPITGFDAHDGLAAMPEEISGYGTHAVDAVQNGVRNRCYSPFPAPQRVRGKRMSARVKSKPGTRFATVMTTTGTDDVTDRLTVFYDGGCPLCSREIVHYRKLHALNRVEWIDITRQPEILDRYGLAPLEALASFHVMDDSTGRMHTGADAFIRLWRVLPGYQWLAKCISFFHLSPILERLYRTFARRHFQKRCREGACGA